MVIGINATVIILNGNNNLFVPEIKQRHSSGPRIVDMMGPLRLTTGVLYRMCVQVYPDINISECTDVHLSVRETHQLDLNIFTATYLRRTLQYIFSKFIYILRRISLAGLYFFLIEFFFMIFLLFLYICKKKLINCTFHFSRNQKK